MTFRKEQHEKQSNLIFDDQTTVLTKVEIMDHYLDSHIERMSCKEICSIVNLLFQIDLSAMQVLNPTEKHLLDFNSASGESTTLPPACEVIDSYLAQQRIKNLTGADIRSMINQIFGVNLAAISALDGARISLFSKGQWIIQHKTNLFAVQTGPNDVDVTVYPTPYFAETTGLSGLPAVLRLPLEELGFHYDENNGSCSYLNSNGEAVPDAFKGQTIGRIIEVIKKFYSEE